MLEAPILFKIVDFLNSNIAVGSEIQAIATGPMVIVLPKIIS